MLVWGFWLGGFYTLGMIMMGRRFRGADLAAINAAFVLMWGFGAISGPSFAGLAMETWGSIGLPLFVAAAYLAYLPVPIIRHLRGRRGDTE